MQSVYVHQEATMTMMEKVAAALQAYQQHVSAMSKQKAY
jgi:hypothetical protein